MKMLSGFSSTINSLTNVVISLLGLGIVVSLLGGNVPFVGGIADNIVGLVQSLGDAGIIIACGSTLRMISPFQLTVKTNPSNLTRSPFFIPSGQLL